MWRFFLLALVFLQDPSKAEAFQIAPTSDLITNAISANKQFKLKINWTKGILTVYKAPGYAVPVWTLVDPENWEKVQPTPYGPSFNSCFTRFFLSNDGKTVTCLARQKVVEDLIEDGIGIEFWDATGKIKSYSFKEICHNPPKPDNANPNSFWRTWYSSAEVDDDRLRMVIPEGEIDFSLADGSILRQNTSIWRLYFAQYYQWGLVFAAVAVVSFFLLKRILKRIARNSNLATLTSQTRSPSPETPRSTGISPVV